MCKKENISYATVCIFMSWVDGISLTSTLQDINPKIFTVIGEFLKQRD